ncbi:MAG: class I SAM-dependent methyltransferase [Candidatus Omnitrophota bacterium]
MTEQKISDWEALYREQDVEKMPWFTPELDHDFSEALRNLKICSGHVLDLGTGPGTQAIALAELGFDVVASDISGSAIRKAEVRSKKKGSSIRFVKDDILATGLKGPFDIIFDRGIFHVFPAEKRAAYVQNVEGLLRKGGYLFLKCFSDKESPGEGPYRISEEEIHRSFTPALEILNIRAGFFKGVRQPNPHALFCVLRKVSGTMANPDTFNGFPEPFTPPS